MKYKIFKNINKYKQCGVSRYIFHLWLHEVSPDSTLIWQPTEEVINLASFAVAYVI